MSVELHIDSVDLRRLERRLVRFADLNVASLLDVATSEVESQSRRRIEDERTAPEGASWPPWSERYERTRHENHQLLQNEGNLVDSLASFVSRNTGQVGSGLIYAATHQFGDPVRNIPERPFVGLSDANLRDLSDVVTDWLDREMGGSR